MGFRIDKGAAYRFSTSEKKWTVGKFFALPTNYAVDIGLFRDAAIADLRKHKSNGVETEGSVQKVEVLVVSTKVFTETTKDGTPLQN